MDFLEETNSQSFIVKVWVEECARDGSRGVWHGHITHVLSHERRYLKNLGEIEDFIAPYLVEMGVRFETSRRKVYWFKRLRMQG